MEPIVNKPIIHPPTIVVGPSRGALLCAEAIMNETLPHYKTEISLEDLDILERDIARVIDREMAKHQAAQEKERRESKGQ